MHPDSSPDSPHSWTWADQLSSYRFWALLALSCFSGFSAGSFSMSIPVLRDTLALDYEDFAVLTSMRTIGVCAGFYLAWAASRAKTALPLLIAALSQLAGGVLMALPIAQPLYPVRLLGAVLFYSGISGILLGVPCVIAGGRGGMRHFLPAFGATYVAREFGLFVVTAALASAIQLLGQGAVLAALACPALVAALMLVPVRRLFDSPPPERGYAFEPRFRHPVVAGLLMLIPVFSFIYLLWWIYHVHGETAFLSPSRALLSPRASVGCSFVPLLLPIMIVALVEELNRSAASRKLPFRASPAGVFWLALLLAPIAVGRLQGHLNRVAATF